jgi:uncharacterized membrane protein
VITAAYQGDVNFISTVSPEVNQVVNTPDFSIESSPLSGTVPVGGSATSTVTITSSNTFSSEVSLSCAAGLPAGATCNFNPSKLTPAGNQEVTSVLTVNAGLSTPAGSYTLTVSGTSGSVTHTYGTLVVDVNDFAITGPTATTPSPITPGQSAVATVTLTSVNGFATPAALSCSGLPIGATCGFTPTTVMPGEEGAESTLTVQTASGTPAGTYNLVITGTAGKLSHSYSTLSLVVSDFAVSGPAETSPAMVTPGQSAAANITLMALGGYSSPVALSCSGLPAGAACSFTPATVTPNPQGAVSALTIASSATTPAGSYGVSVTASAATFAHTYANLAFKVGDFSIKASGATPTLITPGQTATATITVNSLGGFSSPVVLGCSGLPAGISCVFVPATLAPTSVGATSLLTITTQPGTVSGAYPLSVTGTYGMLVRTYQKLELTVGDFVLSPTQLAPAAITPGQSASATVTLTAESGFASQVMLSCAGLPSGATCSFVPELVTPSASGATSQLTITSQPGIAAGNYPVTVTGSAGALTHSYSTLSLKVTDFTLKGPATTSPASFTAGQNATATLTLTALNGFANPVALSCGGLPSGASCKFNPATVMPTGEGASSTLTIATASGTPPGSYSITIDGTAGTLVRMYSALTFGVADFAVSAPASTTPATINPGQSATASMNWNALGGFSGTVMFTCSVSPSPELAPKCSMNPASVEVSGGGVTSTLTVTTTAPTTAASGPALLRRWAPVYALWLPIPGMAMIGLALGGARRRRCFVMLGLLTLLAALSMLAACGGGNNNNTGTTTPGTPAGAYTVTVTGTSGSGTAATTHTAKISLNVQ